MEYLHRVMIVMNYMKLLTIQKWQMTNVKVNAKRKPFLLKKSVNSRRQQRSIKLTCCALWVKRENMTKSEQFN